MSTQIELLGAAVGDRYRIQRELGQGGMATVYLAEDLKHHRKVALKVLRPELGAAMGAERFAREIEVAARLLHPHILGLLDSGEAAGFFYYVMPYVEGETLRERLTRTGELPVQETVRLLSEIADALALAHQHGVVHRDIKPENILLSGRHAMVMDFGIAKALTEASGPQRPTTAGVALGTPAYMAPEQATADPHLDGRVDIYALGVVGYEMLTGLPPFHGLTAQQTLAAHVIDDPPPVEEQRPHLSPALGAIIMRCLAKRPADRYQTAEELVAALEPFATPSGGMTPTDTRPHRGVAPAAGWSWRALALGGGVLVLVAFGVVIVWRGRGEDAPLSLGKTRRVTNAGGLQILPALSPDAKFLAYASTSQLGKPTKIYLQPTDGGRAVAVTDSLAGEQMSPDWSPDGEHLVFTSTDTAQSSIIVMPPTGGSVRAVYGVRTSNSKPLGPRWSPDGLQIAFAEADSLLIINADGTGLRLLGRAPDVHSLAWSPDGRWLAGVRDNPEFVYGNLLRTFGNRAASTVFVVSATGGTPRMVSDSTTLNNSPVWLRDGSGLLYVSSSGGGRDIYEQQIGRGGLAEGSARRITTGVDAHTIALSRDGRRLAYSTYTRDANIWMLRVPSGGRASVRQAVPVTRGNQAIETVKLSPDGKWLAYDSDLNGNADIFVVSTEGGTARQLTESTTDDMAPDWSPDGSQLAFHSFRSGNRDIFTMNADGSGISAVTSSPVHERYPVWATNNSLAYLRDSGALFALAEVTRPGRAAPWGQPSVLATDLNIFLTGSTPDHSAYLATDVDGLPVRVPAGGGSVTPLLAPKAVPYAFYARMRGDGQTLYFFSSDSAGAYIGAADLKRGTTRKVVTFDEPGRDVTRGAFDTDGTRFFFTIAHHQADIWVADVEQR